MPRLIFTAVLVSCAASAYSAEPSEIARPNILWITAEDMSPTLGCYGDEYATTPHIDALAAQSVKYTHAFATAPVCSPSRSTLITGCYATSLGTHQMRSAFPIPDFIKGFPSYLREAGYYTTNNVKTDYNTANEQKIIEASWDESSAKAHWRSRPNEGQPFFSIFNLMTSHQSRTMVWPYEQFQKEVQSRLDKDEIHDPATAPLPPYYPDSPVIRKTVARFYDCVTAMDKEVGAILAQLEEDGLAGDTIVFFYSDHGSGMPRHKRCLYDSGMHVPLLIRFPEKWKHLAPKQDGEQLTAGDVTDRLVSFVDFGPTVLSLAKIDIPDYMQGEPFLGKAETKPREYVFGHRDRIDEVIDMSRSVRTKRYLYIRNYMPHLGWNQPSAWPDQGEIRHEFYRLADREKMTDAQWQFAGPTRPVEELYDCEKDPHNLNNLARRRSNLKQDAMYLDLQLANLHFQKESLDVGLLPEVAAMKISRDRPFFDSGWDTEFDIRELIAASVASGFKGNSFTHRRLMGGSYVSRYWAAIGAAQREEISDASKYILPHFLEDDRVPAAVQIAAADALARHGELEKALPTLIELVADEDLTTVLYAARAIELLGDDAKAAIPAMEKALARAEKIRPPDTPATVVTSGEADLAMFIGFSTRAFLKKVKGEEEQKEAKGAKGDDGRRGKRGVNGERATTIRLESDPSVCATDAPAPTAAADNSPVLQHGVSSPNKPAAERNTLHTTGTSPRPNPSAVDGCDDTPNADDSEMINLFDGETLNGWSARAKGDVTVKDGEIQILSQGANLWLVHEGTFDNFELTLEAKMPDDAYNSGIGFRCIGEGKPKGYQCEIDRAKSGMIYAIGSGWVWPKGDDESAKFKEMAGECFDDEAWNKFRIRCEGNHIQIWINGTQTADVHDDRFSAGSIALQHHGKGGGHRFRNIQLRKLP